MKTNYLKRIQHIIEAVFLIAIVLVVIDYNFFLEYDAHENKPLLFDATKEKKNQINDYEKNTQTRRYYVVYNETDERSIKLQENIVATLASMKQVYKAVPINKFDQSCIKSTDTVMLAMTQWQSYETEIDQLLLKVAEGLRLFVAYIPSEDAVFINYSRKLGIYELGNLIDSDTMSFIGDTIIGLTNDTLKAEVLTTELITAHVVDEATVLIKGEKDIPQFYIYPQGAGRIGVYTADNLYAKGQRGLIAGMLGALEEDLVYPIIQSGVLFLDDFPSPMIGYNEKIKDEYGLDVETFVRDVWWPDVLGLAKQYGVVYTAAMIADYNGIVEPPLPPDGGLQTNMIYYYGKEIIRAGGEVCFHGYNHQPLQFDPYLEEELSDAYKLWPSVDVAEAAMKLGLGKFAEAFPQYAIHGYVPPSNVISPEGEVIVKDVLNNSAILCGLYMADELDITEYDYGQTNGMIYFPRVQSGCFLSDSVKYVTSSMLTYVGVFSHFIHPDDVLDEERSKGLNWQELRLEYEKLLKFLSKQHEYLRMETLTEAGKHVIEWDNMKIQTNYHSENIEVWVKNTSEPYFLIVRTDKKIVPGQDYTYQQIENTTYIINAQKEYINIQLEVRD